MTWIDDLRGALRQHWRAALVPKRAARRFLASRAELSSLIDDRKNDPARAALRPAPPSWAAPPANGPQRRQRARERRIHYLANRLNSASQKVARDFDQSIT